MQWNALRQSESEQSTNPVLAPFVWKLSCDKCSLVIIANGKDALCLKTVSWHQHCAGANIGACWQPGTDAGTNGTKRWLTLTKGAQYSQPSSTAQLAERSAFIWLSSHSSVQVPQVNQFVFYYSVGPHKSLVLPTTTCLPHHYKGSWVLPTTRRFRTRRSSLLPKTTRGWFHRPS